MSRGRVYEKLLLRVLIPLRRPHNPQFRAIVLERASILQTSDQAKCLCKYGYAHCGVTLEKSTCLLVMPIRSPTHHCPLLVLCSKDIGNLDFSVLQDGA
jgi:hypothetical protein